MLTTTDLMTLRRSFCGWYAVLVPVVVCIPLYLGSVFASSAVQDTWSTFSNVAFEIWGVLVPIGAALLCALSVRSDEAAWPTLLATAVPRWRLVLGRFSALAGLTAISSAVLTLLLVGAAGINQAPFTSVGTILAAVWLPWFAGLALIAGSLMEAWRWGLGPTVAVGVVGMLAGALLADKAFWWVVPFAWPMRTILPVAGIAPNGIPYPPGSPLGDLTAVPLALGLAALTTAVLLIATVLQMNRKEL